MVVSNGVLRVCEDDEARIYPFLQLNIDLLCTNLKLKTAEIAQEMNSREEKTSKSGEGATMVEAGTMARPWSSHSSFP